MEKVYVAVRADFRDDGVMLPREITWEDGRRYEIDRVTDIRQAPSLKAGGQGDRYTVMIKSMAMISHLLLLKNYRSALKILL